MSLEAKVPRPAVAVAAAFIIRDISRLTPRVEMPSSARIVASRQPLMSSVERRPSAKRTFAARRLGSLAYRSLSLPTVSRPFPDCSTTTASAAEGYFTTGSSAGILSVLILRNTRIPTVV